MQVHRNPEIHYSECEPLQSWFYVSTVEARRGNLPPWERAVESQGSSSLGCSLAEADYSGAKARGDVTLQLLAPAEC